MTYQSDEISAASGQPVELYRFRLRDTNTYWRYTSAAYNITYDGQVYVTTPGVSSSKFEESDDTLKTELTVSMPSDHVFPNLFLFNTPNGIIDFTLFRGHGTNFIQYWDGIVKTIYPIDSNDYASFVCGPHTDEANAPFVTRTYERICDVPLFGPHCGLSAADWKVTATLSSVSGTSLLSSVFQGYSNNYFKGGYVDYSGVQRRIKSHTTDTLTLVSQIPGIAAGAVVYAYPGCDHLRATCIATFNNLPNYRGCDWIPDDEPFTQGVLK